MIERQLLARCRRIVKCDTARIARTGGKLYLIIGFNRTRGTMQANGTGNGEPYDYPYVEEHTIASGATEQELLASVREYRRLCGMTMEEYIVTKARKPCRR